MIRLMNQEEGRNWQWLRRKSARAMTRALQI